MLSVDDWREAAQGCLGSQHRAHINFSGLDVREFCQAAIDCPREWLCACIRIFNGFDNLINVH